MQKSYSCRTGTKMQLPVIRPREFSLNLIVLLWVCVCVGQGVGGFEVPAGFFSCFFCGLLLFLVLCSKIYAKSTLANNFRVARPLCKLPGKLVKTTARWGAQPLKGMLRVDDPTPPTYPQGSGLGASGRHKVSLDVNVQRQQQEQ